MNLAYNVYATILDNQLDTNIINNDCEKYNDMKSKNNVKRRSLILQQSETLSIPDSISAETPISPDAATNDNEEKDNLYPLQNERSYTPFISTTKVKTTGKYKAIITEQETLKHHGYKYMNKISDTLQGYLIKASITTYDDHKDIDIEYKQSAPTVAIKITNKNLHKLSISVQADGDNVCVEENIITEASILKYLTYDNQMTADYLVRYVDFFQDEYNYYLVMEYIDGITLSEFIKISHKHIKHKLMDLKYFKKIVKYLSWQLASITHYLHSMKVAHLELSDFDNIMIVNGDFIVQNGPNHNITINPEISIKIVDFGMSELFLNKDTEESIECFKSAQLVGNPHFKSPQCFAELIYDPFKNDIWSLGIILYYLSTGRTPYLIANEMMDSGYNSIARKQLQLYIMTQNLQKHVGPKLISLLCGMLKMKEKHRFNSSKVIQHEWFKSYYATYKDRLVVDMDKVKTPY